MLPAVLTTLLTYTVRLPFAPSHTSLAPIHSLECLTRRLPLTLRNVSRPVRNHGAVIVAAECAMSSNPGHTFALRMLTDRADESHVFCMTHEGCLIAQFFFKVTPVDAGHEIMLETRCYRDQRRARLLVRCMAETIINEVPRWRFDFEQHPNLRKYRELVFQGQ